MIANDIDLDQIDWSCVWKKVLKIDSVFGVPPCLYLPASFKIRKWRPR